MLKTLWQYRTFFLVSLLVVTTGVAVRSCVDTRAQLAASQQSFATQVQLNDSTSALLASTRLRNDTLHSLLKAKDQLQGKLLAGLVIRVPARDTTVSHQTLSTTVTVDSTRVATFRDSTFAGVLTGTVTAPPCCQPLALTYSVQRPAFAPSVGFLQVGSKQVAVVVWQGERVELEAPYVNLPKPVKRLGTFVEGSYLVGGGAVGRVGAFARTSTASWGGFVAGEQVFTAHADGPRLEIGLRKEF